jgi:NADPH:quinone reductase-like Zn-dependent oxidoreductase
LVIKPDYICGFGLVRQNTQTALKPKSIDHVHAATIPVGAVTAWRALFDSAGVKEGQKVLIHGAAGGVGASPSNSRSGRERI